MVHGKNGIGTGKNGTGKNGTGKNGTNEKPVKMTHLIKITIKELLKTFLKLICEIQSAY